MAKRRRKNPTTPIEWAPCPEADALVGELVPKYHPHLAAARIVCVTKPKAGRRKGKPVAAVFKKVTPLMNVLTQIEAGPGFDYVIEIGADLWNAMPKETRLALIDHELCHGGGRDEKDRWTLVGHDVEEFAVILRRHGAWHVDLELFVKEARQLPLPGVER